MVPLKGRKLVLPYLPRDPVFPGAPSQDFTKPSALRDAAGPIMEWAQEIFGNVKRKAQGPQGAMLLGVEGGGMGMAAMAWREIHFGAWKISTLRGQGAQSGQTMDTETEIQVMRDVVKDAERRDGGSWCGLILWRC